MDIKILLGKKIKYYRNLRGLTQEELAEALNISQRTLSGIECGDNFLSAKTLQGVLDTLAISPNELFQLEHLKPQKDLVAELFGDIKSIEDDEEKLKLIYKLVKAVIKD